MLDTRAPVSKPTCAQQSHACKTRPQMGRFDSRPSLVCGPLSPYAEIRHTAGTTTYATATWVPREVQHLSPRTPASASSTKAVRTARTWRLLHMMHTCPVYAARSKRWSQSEHGKCCSFRCAGLLYAHTYSIQQSIHQTHPQSRSGASHSDGERLLGTDTQWLACWHSHWARPVSAAQASLAAKSTTLDTRCCQTPASLDLDDRKLPGHHSCHLFHGRARENGEKPPCAAHGSRPSAARTAWRRFSAGMLPDLGPDCSLPATGFLRCLF